jgi:hypothetical protein
MPRKKGSQNKSPSEMEREAKRLIEIAKLKRKIKSLQGK